MDEQTSPPSAGYPPAEPRPSAEDEPEEETEPAKLDLIVDPSGKTYICWFATTIS